MFQVIRRTDYSLWALIYLAQQGGRIVQREEIAAVLGVPSESLALALKNLARMRLLRSFRGTGGGFQLGRPAKEITLRHIVEAVEGQIVLNRCLIDAGSCDRQPLCKVHDVWLDVQSKMNRVLESYTVEQLANEKFDER